VIALALDLQTIRDRLLCSGYDSEHVGIWGMRERFVIDVRLTAVCHSPKARLVVTMIEVRS
jgi:hypothetical protein